MERKLASIQRIIDIQPIPEADLIEVATVNAWKLVVKKGEFKVGQFAIYCEIDSFLPIKPEYEFLRKSCHRMMGTQEGFRIKTIKLKGQISQGLLLPILDDTFPYVMEEGWDVTEFLDITKWEKAMPSQLSGIAKGDFPSFIPKTDEERIQNLTKYYEQYKGNSFYFTEKLDGSSATFYFNEGVFGVCSRNLDLLESEENAFWKVANEMDLHNKLVTLGRNIALQGELIGTGIQGNMYKLNNLSVRFFNAFDISTQEYLPLVDFVQIIADLGLNTVPILSSNVKLPDTIDQLLEIANNKSILNPQKDREGIVVRSMDMKISFKVISNKFLLKEE